MDLTTAPRLAKINRPRLPPVYPRQRLFKLMDDARKSPVVWIEAPPGSGKTTLVASYAKQRDLPCLWYQADEGDADVASFFYYMSLLVDVCHDPHQDPLPLFSAEYLENLPTFTRNFFRQFYNRTPNPCLIVIDNYQDVPADGLLHELMQYSLAEIPDGINVCILSRTARPPSFARLSANGMIHYIHWNEIRLTEAESAEIVQLRTQVKPAIQQDISQLHQQTKGWVAGLVLLLEQSQDQHYATIFNEDFDMSLVFDYFANEVLQKSDPSIQNFLLSTAIFPHFTVPMAEKLSNDVSALPILSDLNRRNYFTVQHMGANETYEYHPLFREFLRHRARQTFAPQKLHDLHCRAAHLLVESNNIEDAANIFISIQQWPDLITLIATHAKTILAQGRFHTLNKWLNKLPNELIQQNPWLLMWLGACQQPYNIALSRDCYEQAYTEFRTHQDDVGVLIAWAGIVDTYIYEWADIKPLDYWIAQISDHLADCASFPDIETETKVASGMLKALMYRQPQHKKIAFWAQRLESLILNDTLDPTLRIMAGNHLLFYHSWWTGNLINAAAVFENLRKATDNTNLTPFTRIVWLGIQANYLRLAGDLEGCLTSVKAGLGLAKQSGIHMWDFILYGQGVWGSLAMEDFTTATRYQKHAEALVCSDRHLDMAHYHFIAFSYALYTDDAETMLKHAQAGVEQTCIGGSSTGEAYFETCLARAYHANAEPERALDLYNKVINYSRATHSRMVEYHCLLGIIEIKITQQIPAAKIDELQTFFTLSKHCGIVNCSAWRNSIMRQICTMALGCEIQTEHIHALIRKRGLTPPSELPNNIQWPWPILIYTLGEFKLQIDGVATLSGDRPRNKPLLLLKALLALGGKYVPQTKLSDMLWPDADGDAAHHSFETTLYRLRKLLVYEKALVLQDGKLSLSTDYCWVDAWEFEKIVHQLKQTPPNTLNNQHAQPLKDKLIQLYAGPFLNELNDVGWAYPLREKISKQWHSITS